MRVLFTVQPSTGHLHPLVPAARALEEAGHEVAVCSSASFREEVEAFGLKHFAAGLDWLTGDHSTWTAFPPMPAPGPEFAKFVVTVFADITTARMVPDLLDIAHEWRPDLIIREHFEFGGCIAAEVLGIPHASIAGNAYSAVDSPHIKYFPGNRLMVAEAMARHRAQFGLPPDPDVLMPFRRLHIAFTPASWDADGSPRPANLRHFRHTSAVRPGARLAEWVGQLPDRPTVFASLGTVFNNTPGVLEAIVSGLAEEPINLIVAIGRNGDAARFGAVPENVRLEPYVEQPLLLEHCDAFVTHGGFNSVKEAAILGVPMVVVPITADQPYSAERCAALGIGRALGADSRTPETIRSAVVAVLQEPGYRESAQRFQAEMLALPGAAELVGVIEQTARDGAAIA
ncbi:MAG TPA: glycosyltransferase [Candidatus Dormibacteraeota bacterium]|nr:glycosyltransferase [Candidatus Dormibacteraeota bacterium]